MITEKDYLNLKEMWDYQRMLEYNKELLRTRIKSLLNEVMFTDATEEDMFDTFWSKMKDCEKRESWSKSLK